MPLLLTRIFLAIFFLKVFMSPFAFAKESTPVLDTQASNLYASNFLMNPELQLKYDTVGAKGLVFVKTPNREQNTHYSVVTDFADNVIRMRLIPGLKDKTALQKFLKSSLKTQKYEGVEIHQMTLPNVGEGETTAYWVGHKFHGSLDEAKSQIALLKALAQAEGIDFAQMIKESHRYHMEETGPALEEVVSEAQFKREEEIFLKYLDHLDIGNEMFGPFTGTPAGEKVTWQAFGEMTWRDTNLDKKNFSDEVGFFTNRIVFKGIRFPFNTVDPFVEATIAGESNGKDAGSHLTLFGGVEWRPMARSHFLTNFRVGDIPLLDFVKNYRFYVQYGDRKNIKEEIFGIRDYDLIAGVSIFYEFGVEPRELNAPRPETFSDYLREYVWGEYFGNYRYEMTNFGTESNGNFDAWIWNSSIILGLKTPTLALPDNPVLPEISLMPYMRYEHVNNTQHSFSFQNQHFVAAGLRWMPFRNWRYKENEWLAKTKVFFEYVGVGKVQHAKQDGEAPSAERNDLRFGVNISYRRF